MEGSTDSENERVSNGLQVKTSGSFGAFKENGKRMSS